MKKIALLSWALMLAFFWSGCNTAEGVGRDMEELGQEIQEET